MKTSQSLPPQRLSSPPQSLATGTSLTPLFFYPTLPTGEGCTLQALETALGPPAPELAGNLLRGWTNARFHALGCEIAPERILDSVPRIVGMAAASLGSLPEQTASVVLLDPGILALIVREARAIEPLSREWDHAAHAQHALVVAWNARRARVRQVAIGHRDVVAQALTRALGDQAEVVRATRGDAEDDAALALGVESVAALAEHTLANGSEAERAALLCFKVNSARVKVLREKAAAVQALGAPPVALEQDTTQRKLDIQEGRVLVLLDILLTAMREAKKLDAALVMPELGRLRTWFYPPRRKKTAAVNTPTEQPK